MRTKSVSGSTKRLDQLDEGKYFKSVQHGNEDIFVIPGIAAALDSPLNKVKSGHKVVYNLTKDILVLSPGSSPVIVMVQDHDVTFIESIG